MKKNHLYVKIKTYKGRWKMTNKLEQKILDLKKEYQKKEYHNSDKNIDDIDKNVIIDQANAVSNEVLKAFFKDEEPPLKITSLMTNLGFDLLKNSQFPQKELSGLLALNLKEKLAGKYSDKVIIVNGQDSIGHQRFTIAHELAHYIFDAIEGEEYYEAYYRTDEENTKKIKEYRANKFAANLLMPEDIFKRKYYELLDRFKDIDLVKNALTVVFKVSYTAVDKRFDELKLGYINDR